MPYCSCDDNDDVVYLRHCQKFSDFLISLSFFSIPLQFLYFLNNNNSSTGRFLTRFAPFLVLSGLTHFLNALTHSAPNSFPLLALNLLKFFTALQFTVTSLPLARLMPQILRIMAQHVFLVQKSKQPSHDIGLMKRKEEASRLALTLSREIRKSLDRRTILETCVNGLSKAFALDSCEIWLSDESASVLVLSHESRRRTGHESVCQIPMDDDPEIAKILARNGVGFLPSNSKLANTPGAVIRLWISCRKAETAWRCSGVLVLGGERNWGSSELEIVEIVANQVAMALSHAAIFEESLLVREKLIDHSIALHREKELAVKVNEAMCLFWTYLNREFVISSRSMAAILSVLQIENWLSEESQQQRTIAETMATVGLLLSGLVEEDSYIELKPHSVSLVSILKQVGIASKIMCAIRGLNFEIWVRGKVPKQVIGDEMRITQAILTVVLKILGLDEEFGTVVLSVVAENGSQDSSDPNYRAWKQSVYKGSVLLKFDVNGASFGKDYRKLLLTKCNNSILDDGNTRIDLGICEKLAKLMQGSVSVGHNSEHPGRTLK